MTDRALIQAVARLPATPHGHMKPASWQLHTFQGHLEALLGPATAIVWDGHNLGARFGKRIITVQGYEIAANPTGLAQIKAG